MKKIVINIPCYNEKGNIENLCNTIEKIFREQLNGYDYMIQIMDNASTDGTQALIRDLCEKNKKIRAILNARNFGAGNSIYNGLSQNDGDCAILLAADFQEPPEMIVKFVEEWEKGAKIVCGVKTSSKEKGMMFAIRTLYYKIIQACSSIEQIEHFTGFGLYDRSFTDFLRDLKDPYPSLRGLVAEFGYDIVKVEYFQEKRKSGRSSNNFYRLYDIAMKNFTTYTKVGLRLASLGGIICSGIGMLLAIVYLVLKLVMWDSFQAGMAPVLIGVFLFCSVQMFFIGLLGEYIISMNIRIMNRPLVVERERLNFEEADVENEAKE